MIKEWEVPQKDFSLNDDSVHTNILNRFTG